MSASGHPDEALDRGGEVVFHVIYPGDPYHEQPERIKAMWRNVADRVAVALGDKHETPGSGRERQK